MDNTKTINVLSLCTGYGGLELGLAGALEGVLRVVAVEIEAYALANLASKAQEGKLAIETMWPDLKTFPAEKFRGCFDFILAGYPCQPFSVAGKRKGTDDPRHLWPHIARIVEAVRPVWCIFENVPGHLSIGYPEVYRSLRDMGYKVEAGLFTAAEVGAPHKRQRLFIMAERRNKCHQSEYLQQELQSECYYKTFSIGSSKLADTETTERGRLSEEHAGRGTEETGRSDRGQLANPGRATSGNQGGQTDGRTRQEDVPQGHGATGTVRFGAAGQLADTGFNAGSSLLEQQQKECAEELSRSVELADTGSTELSGRKGQSGNDGKKLQAITGSCDKWPARPGQPQYEWEEPRVVVHAGSTESRGLSGSERQAISEIGKTSEVGNASEHNRRKARGRIQAKTERKSGSARYTNTSRQGQA